MGLGVYLNFGSEENPDFSKLCEAQVENVYMEDSDVRLDGDCNWEMISGQKDRVCLISK